MLFRKADPNKERFEKLSEQVYPSLLISAMRLTRDRDAASDLAQDALIRAYEAFDRFDGRNFKAWMMRIMTNLYINNYRKTKREGNNESLDEEYAAEPSASDDVIPDRVIFDEMLGEEIEAALDKVPADFRMAVLLSDVEGMSYEEIAEATQVPIGTVRSRLARGRAMLRKQLERFAIERGYIKSGELDVR